MSQPEPVGGISRGMEDFIEVWQDDRHASGFAVRLADEEKPGVGNGADVLGGIEQILQADRHKAPITLECGIINAADNFELLLEFREIEGAHGEIGAFLEALDDSDEALRRVEAVHREIHHIKRAGFLETEVGEQAQVVVGIPRQADHGRFIEAV